jgi:chromosome segregation and condensation protein ScpB
MNLTDSQKKIFAILFAAGEPLETDRLAEALAISHAEAAEQCVLLQTCHWSCAGWKTAGSCAPLPAMIR